MSRSYTLDKRQNRKYRCRWRKIMTGHWSHYGIRCNQERRKKFVKLHFRCVLFLDQRILAWPADESETIDSKFEFTPPTKSMRYKNLYCIQHDHMQNLVNQTRCWSGNSSNVEQNLGTLQTVFHGVWPNLYACGNRDCGYWSILGHQDCCSFLNLGRHCLLHCCCRCRC